MSFLEGVEKSIRLDERSKMKEEGYIHKSKCPRAREDNKLKQLKKENKSLQRKVTELRLQIEYYNDEVMCEMDQDTGLCESCNHLLHYKYDREVEIDCSKGHEARFYPPVFDCEDYYGKFS